MTGELDRSGFLGGQLQIWQPMAGYRAGTDPVLLAAAVPAVAGQSVLELGLGVGVASLCLGRRVPGLTLTGIEVQPDYAALARRNAAENGILLEVVEADIAALPKELRQRCFDHVIANPPYFPARGRSTAADAGREAARSERAPLADWVAVALKRLRPGGMLTMIQAASRLGDLMRALPATGCTLIPLAGRAGRDADRVILRHRKDGRAALRLSAPLILHDGALHLRDGDDYAPWARACLRDAAALPASV
jgi:tRNA1(Val) A37 N6-methylase TrmN6